MARHKSRVRHTRRRRSRSRSRSRTRSRKQSGGWFFGLLGNKEEHAATSAPEAAAPEAEKKKIYV